MKLPLAFYNSEHMALLSDAVKTLGPDAHNRGWIHDLLCPRETCGEDPAGDGPIDRMCIREQLIAESWGLADPVRFEREIVRELSARELAEIAARVGLTEF